MKIYCIKNSHLLAWRLPSKKHQFIIYVVNNMFRFQVDKRCFIAHHNSKKLDKQQSWHRCMNDGVHAILHLSKQLLFVICVVNFISILKKSQTRNCNLPLNYLENHFTQRKWGPESIRNLKFLSVFKWKDRL